MIMLTLSSFEFLLDQNQGWKKIIDLDLKDRDHQFDLDLFGDLDQC